MLKSIFSLLSGALLLPALACAAAATLPLDQQAVRSYYGDGDFGPAISLLEDFQKTHSRFTREESLMVYKFLGVMYCADQSTREKGKTYFYKLLQVDPQAKILDMYVSIMVQEIFRSTLDELMGEQSQRPSGQRTAAVSGMGATDAAKSAGPASNPEPTGTQPALERPKRPAWYWWAGGVGLAAGAAGGFYLYAQSSHNSSTATDIQVKP
jgi:hypothetical protein